MDKFFKLHPEKRIGYKALTMPDLGQKQSSHQTHIGLFDDILTFLPNNTLVDSYAMLIYNSNIEFLNLNFDRIRREDGTYESPKIKTGGCNAVSIASTIRNIAKQCDEDVVWYLFWFGLESEQAVFILFNNLSKEYLDITNMGLELNAKSKGRIKDSNSLFDKLLFYIENTLNISTREIVKELEIESLIPGKLITENKIRKFDIERARKRSCEIGKLGEEYVAEYFEKLKFEHKIDNYCWENSSSESGYPYDFWYQNLLGNIIYLDVKTATFDFDQKIIYSDKEVEFAVSKPQGCYNIYRVYNLTENNANLRICRNCLQHFEKINNNIVLFQNNLGTINTNIYALNVAFQPDIDNLSFDSQINLSK